MTSADAPSNDGTVPSGEKPAESKAPLRPWQAPGAGVVVVLMLVIFAAFAVWTAIDAGGKDATGRALIFGVVEVFAGATLGWYFGSAVQSERVAQAETQARQAARDAENGRALAALVLAREGRVVENDGGSTLTDTKLTDDQKLRREYADAARLLFPYALGRTKPTDKTDALDSRD